MDAARKSTNRASYNKAVLKIPHNKAKNLKKAK
nr:MAG TPA: hypothetical protein [Bacteriophage sp.]